MITITFGSFHIGNRDPLLPRFFESFINFTQTPAAFEFLIKLDEGDDYIFYHKLKKQYEGKLSIRFVVSSRGRGYADMHLWHSSLIQHRSPTSKALYILTEDAEFYFKNWDAALLRLVRDRKNTFFIATPCKLEEAITIMGPNPEKPVPVYWVRGDDFPIFGFDLLRTAEHFTRNYPNWVALGNLFNVDGYSGDLLRIAWNDFQVNLHEEVQLYALRKGVYDWSESPVRGNLRNKTLIEFFQDENIKIRKDLVLKIIEDLNLSGICC